jgi:hypothetical protein
MPSDVVTGTFRWLTSRRPRIDTSMATRIINTLLSPYRAADARLTDRCPARRLFDRWGSHFTFREGK